MYTDKSAQQEWVRGIHKVNAILMKEISNEEYSSDNNIIARI